VKPSSEGSRAVVKVVSCAGEEGGIPRALYPAQHVSYKGENCGGGGEGRETDISARRTSPMGMTPSFSPSMGSAKREKASRISDSSCAVRLCSLASLEGRAPVDLEEEAAAEDAPAAGGRRRGG
jgi:hypothetical protein